MWILITLIVATYLLFNVIITLVCAEEQPMNTPFKALMITLGLPIMIVLLVAVIIEIVRKGKIS